MRETVAKDIIKIKKRTELIYVKEEDILRPGREDIRAKAHYLYWSCFRGEVQLVRYILDVDAISPFFCVYDHKSPLMAALIGKHRQKAVSEIHLLSKNRCAYLLLISFRL